MSRVDSPRLVQREDLVVKPLKAPLALSDDLRSKLPSRSRGASIPTWPCSVISVLGLVPLRVFPAPPGGSACGS